jgi:hypothetical protein
MLVKASEKTATCGLKKESRARRIHFMNDSGTHRAIPTLICLWSAMLGGAFGAALGKISSTLLCSGAIGLFVGATASVLVHMFLSIILYLITSYIFEAELSDYTVGGYNSNSLAGVLGGITGLCSASILTLALPSQNLQTLQTFSVCWSAATFLPLMLMLVLLWRTERS